jgi:hypothetical protein
MRVDFEFEKLIEKAIQKQEPIWAGVWIDIEKRAIPIWINVGNKQESTGRTCQKGESSMSTQHTPGPAQQPWGFHIYFNNGKDATFKGLDKLAEFEAHQEADEVITLLYSQENT